MGYEQTIIIGHVGRDPEMRYTQSGTAVCNFSVAVSTRWKDKNTGEQRENTKWYRVSAWRELAETCASYVRKGMQVMVVGDVGANAYVNNSGQATASLELTARTVQFLGKRDDNNGTGPSGDEYEQPPINPEDIPF